MATRFIFLVIMALAPIFSPSSTMRYAIQPGTPVAIPNFINPEAECSWSGIGGQVFDRNGVPVAGLVVHIGGTLEGAELFRYIVTGEASQLGPGGFETSLADHLIASHGTLYLQLLDLTGAIVSPQIRFDTYGDCEKGLVLINLVELPSGNETFFPLIYR